MMRLRGRVGQRAFEAVAHLDAHAPVVLRDQQQHAVIDLPAPELPLLGHADGELLDVLGLRGRHDQHRDLRALALLERGQLLLERRLLLGGQRAGEIGDPRLERRHRLSPARSAADADSTSSSAAVPPGAHARCVFHRAAVARLGRRRGALAPAPQPVPKSTVGGVAIAASFSTVKFGFTSKSNIIAVRLVGNERTVVLKACTASM